MTQLMLNRAHYPVTALGPGVRAGLWTQGCTIGCRGCASTDTWGQDPARLVDVSQVVDWLDSLPTPDGLTITGGEPFQQVEALTALLCAVGDWSVRRRSDVDVLVYSGYTYSALLRRPGAAAALSLCDAVITGPYVERLNPGLPWRGSSNQRLVVLTERGLARFGDADQEAFAGEPIRRFQASSDGDRMWLIGVPRRGDLIRLEEAMASRGITVEGMSWRD